MSNNVAMQARPKKSKKRQRQRTSMSGRGSSHDCVYRNVGGNIGGASTCGRNSHEAFHGGADGAVWKTPGWPVMRDSLDFEKCCQV